MDDTITENSRASQASQKTLFVVIPAYNEECAVGRTVAEIQAIRDRLLLNNVQLFICVIDDGSQDSTSTIASKAGADRVVRHKVNLGLGAALRTGIRCALEAQADILVKIDADLQHNPSDIVSIIEPILNDDADIVYGNRFNKIEYKMPLVRRVGNRFFSWLMRLLTGWPIEDAQPGIFAINHDYLEVAYLPGDYNYTQQLLINAYLNKMRFAQTDVSFRRRTTGRSFISLRYPVKVFAQILIAVASVRPLVIFVPIGMVFLLAGLAIFAWQFTYWLIFHTGRPVENTNLVLGCIIFGVQSLYFGLLAHLIVQKQRR
jgi:glycosyltransferase involved in cell wall biosynthesis